MFDFDSIVKRATSWKKMQELSSSLVLGWSQFLILSYEGKKSSQSILRVLSSARVGIQLKTKLKITKILFASALMFWKENRDIIFSIFSQFFLLTILFCVIFLRPPYCKASQRFFLSRCNCIFDGDFTHDCITRVCINSISIYFFSFISFRLM